MAVEDLLEARRGGLFVVERDRPVDHQVIGGRQRLSKIAQRDFQPSDLLCKRLQRNGVDRSGLRALLRAQAQRQAGGRRQQGRRHLGAFQQVHVRASYIIVTP
jgi:hypothetical protein